MKCVVDSRIKTSGWMPGNLNPERPGYYQRDRRTRVPRPDTYWAPEDVHRFLAEYPPPADLQPANGTEVEMEYWDGRQWLLDGLHRMPSYVGPGKEKCYWRGIEYDEQIHQPRMSLVIFEGPK